MIYRKTGKMLGKTTITALIKDKIIYRYNDKRYHNESLF